MATPLPELDWTTTRPFWDAARNERFVMPRCRDCERYVWYPEERCPMCGGERIAWVGVSGRGRLFSWAEVKHLLHPPYEGQLPYVSGLISLEEAPYVRYVTRIVDCEPADLSIDMPMEVVFRKLAFENIETEVMAPMFRPGSSSLRPITTRMPARPPEGTDSGKAREGESANRMDGAGSDGGRYR